MPLSWCVIWSTIIYWWITVAHVVIVSFYGKHKKNLNAWHIFPSASFFPHFTNLVYIHDSHIRACAFGVKEWTLKTSRRWCHRHHHCSSLCCLINFEGSSQVTQVLKIFVFLFLKKEINDDWMVWKRGEVIISCILCVRVYNNFIWMQIWSQVWDQFWFCVLYQLSTLYRCRYMAFFVYLVYKFLLVFSVCVRMCFSYTNVYCMH